MAERVWKRMTLTAAAMSLLLSGCSILPKEEVFSKRPVFEDYEIENYKTTTVKRGDLTLEKNVQCTYLSVNKEYLSFPTGGEYMEGIYVTRGQQVRAGDLVAQLDQAGLEEKIADGEYRIRELELKEAHLIQNWELAVKKVNAGFYDEIKASMDDTARLAQIGQVDHEYTKQLQEIRDTLYVEQMKLEELKKERTSRRLVAGIDGVVTFLRDKKGSMRTVEEETLVIISDMGQTAFIVTGEDAALFPVGAEVTVLCNEKEYSTVSVSAGELGIMENISNTAYLKLLEADPALEDNENGKIVVQQDSRTDVLYVEKKAVKVIDGVTSVYIPNDKGMRKIQEVSVGLECGHLVEITAGLQEGDSVIME